MAKYHVTTDGGTFEVTTDEPDAVPGMEGLAGQPKGHTAGSFGNQPPPVPKPYNFLSGQETSSMSGDQPSKTAQDNPILSELWKSTAIPNPEAMSAGPLGEGLGSIAVKSLGGGVKDALEDFNLTHPLSPKPLMSLAKGTATEWAARVKDAAIKQALQAAPPTAQRVPVWTGPSQPPAAPPPDFAPTPGALPSGRQPGSIAAQAAPEAPAAPPAPATPPVANATPPAPVQVPTPLDELTAAARRVFGKQPSSSPAASPQPETAAPAKAVPPRGSNVVTIPFSEDPLPAEAYAGSARATKSQALAFVLHHFEDVNPADAIKMSPAQRSEVMKRTAQAVRAGGGSPPDAWFDGKVSDQDWAQAVVELKKLRSRSIAQELANQMSKSH